MKPDHNFDKPRRVGFHREPVSGKAFESLPNRVSALVAIEQFDYAAIDGDESEPREVCGVNVEVLGIAFARVCEWVFRDIEIQSRKNKQGRPHGVKARCYAAAWLMRPSAFGNPSEKQMARRFNISTRLFCKCVRSFCESFDYKSSLLKTDEQRAKMSASAIKRHADERSLSE